VSRTAKMFDNMVTSPIKWGTEVPLLINAC